MSWRLKVLFDDGTEELVDEEFETMEDALRERDDWLDGYSVGRDILEEAGEDFCDNSIEDFEIWEE